jgi:2-haloacid dehalogenase
MTPAVYVFDAYGTLFDVHAAALRHREAIGPHAERLSDIWRTKQLEYTWTISLMDRYRDFRDLTAAALDVAAAMSGGLPAGMREKLLAAYEELEAYADVAPVLKALRASGGRTAILSNGSPSMLENAVRAAGLPDQFDAIISIDALRVYKPRPAVYGLVAKRFATAPQEVLFLSSNRWDVAGAKAFGFQTVWLNRTGKTDEYTDLPPDRIIRSLDELI